MKVVVANDHGAVDLANKVVSHLKAKNIDVVYLGTDKEESVDYPDQAREAVEEYRKGGYDFGIVLCGTGIGISIAANKMKGIRCALVQDSYSAIKAKEHNNANFIAFGGRVKYPEPVENIIDAYINAKFEGGRHNRRVDKLMDLEGR